MKGFCALILCCLVYCVLSYPVPERAPERVHVLDNLIEKLYHSEVNREKFGGKINSESWQSSSDLPGLSENVWEDWVDEEGHESEARRSKNTKIMRQHWSPGYVPGGKRKSGIDNTGSAHNLDSRQHWSYDYMPGGKRSISDENAENANDESAFFPMESLTDGENLQNAALRQHWSYDYMPGGKRFDPAQPDGHSMNKRQHWSKGYAPGGKRSVDLSRFEATSREKRSEGMPEVVFKVEQPKPEEDTIENSPIDQEIDL